MFPADVPWETEVRKKGIRALTVVREAILLAVLSKHSKKNANACQSKVRSEIASAKKCKPDEFESVSPAIKKFCELALQLLDFDA